MTVLTAKKNQKLRNELKEYLTKHSKITENKQTEKQILDAFHFAEKAHAHTIRYSGEAYITHPLEVAKIVAGKIGLGPKSVMAALLHDVPEKTEISTDDLKGVFDSKVVEIVEALQQIKNSEYFENNTQASVFRQILLSVSDDIRVILIKIADKLHNIRTANYLPTERKRTAVQDILNIYAPLAHRLGLYEIKSEMEDLCLLYSNPHIYNSISEKINSSETERMQFINRFMEPVSKRLSNENIRYRTESRTKSVFSIWKKMQNKNIPFEEVYDLFAVRIIFKPENPENENFEALRIASLISRSYTEKPDRTRNWLETPKDTGYRALHLTVMSNEGKWVEVQIRSESMHEAAEYGFASHTKYKGIEEKKTEFDSKVRSVLQSLNDEKVSASDFLDNLKLNLFVKEIFVFTPDGKPVSIPKNSTALDFAFYIHTNLAYKSIAAKVNGATMPLKTVLKSGDLVEIISSEKQQPQKEWFDFVITHRALSGLKRAFREERKRYIREGKAIVDFVIESRDIDNKKKAKQMLTDIFNLRSLSELYLKSGEGKITKTELTKILKQKCENKKGRFWKLKSAIAEKVSNKKENILEDKFELAECCRPHPGDKLRAIKLPETGKLQVHKQDCRVLQSHIGFGYSAAEVEWVSYTALSELTRFEITGRDAPGVLSKIVNIISNDFSVNINRLNVETQKGTFRLDAVLLLKNEDYSDKIQLKLQKIKEIDEVSINYS